MVVLLEYVTFLREVIRRDVTYANTNISLSNVYAYTHEQFAF